MSSTPTVAANHNCARHWFSSSVADVLHPCTAALLESLVYIYFLLSSLFFTTLSSVSSLPRSLRNGSSERHHAHGSVIDFVYSWVLPSCCGVIRRPKKKGVRKKDTQDYFQTTQRRFISSEVLQALKQRWQRQQHCHRAVVCTLPFRRALPASLNHVRSAAMKDDMTRGGNGEWTRRW